MILEGSAIVEKAWPCTSARMGRRTLFTAHLNAPGDFSAVDVTDPRKPEVIFSQELVNPKSRSNCLMIVGDSMAVSRQVVTPGDKPAGVEFFDIADPANPKSVGFWDASGPQLPRVPLPVVHR